MPTDDGKSVYNLGLRCQRQQLATKARIAGKATKIAGQGSKKSVIIEGFADRSGVSRKRRRKAGVTAGFVNNIQPISVGV